MKHNTPQKLKFKRLQKRLGIPLWQAVGVLETMWIVTYNNTSAGDIGQLSNEDIALMIEWDGDADELVEALVHAKFIDEDPEFRLIIHDWSQHCANFLKGNFSKHGKPFADVVAKQRASEPAKESAKQTARQPAKHRATKPNLTKPNPTQPREAPNGASCVEPRSEASPPDDEIPEEPGVGDLSPDDPPDTGQPPEPPDSTAMAFPIKGGRDWTLTKGKLTEYEQVHPHLDVRGEFNKARQWCRDNPSKRKTAGGMPRFLNAWLSRAANNGHDPPKRADGYGPIDESVYEAALAAERAEGRHP